MKPNEFDVNAGGSSRIEPHPRPTLRSQLVTAAKLCTVAGALFMALWIADQMVAGL